MGSSQRRGRPLAVAASSEALISAFHSRPLSSESSCMENCTWPESIFVFLRSRNTVGSWLAMRGKSSLPCASTRSRNRFLFSPAIAAACSKLRPSAVNSNSAKSESNRNVSTWNAFPSAVARNSRLPRCKTSVSPESTAGERKAASRPSSFISTRAISRCQSMVAIEVIRPSMVLSGNRRARRGPSASSWIPDVSQVNSARGDSDSLLAGENRKTAEI